MNYNTKMDAVQGGVKYGHFKATVTYRGSSDVDLKIEMVDPIITPKYNEYLDRVRWDEQIALETRMLMAMISDFTQNCWLDARGERNAV